MPVLVGAVLTMSASQLFDLATFVSVTGNDGFVCTGSGPITCSLASLGVGASAGTRSRTPAQAPTARSPSTTFRPMPRSGSPSISTSAARAQNISCLVPNPLTKPVTYGPFTSTATVNVAGVPVAASTTSTSLIGRGKKVTMVYGVAKDSAGAALPNTWIQLTQSGKSALVLTEIDGSYLVYDGQLCSGDGLVSCSVGTSWTFATGTVNGTLAVLANVGTAAATATYPTGHNKFKITSKGSTIVALNANPPTTTFGIAKGSSYNRDWAFTPTP